MAKSKPKIISLPSTGNITLSSSHQNNIVYSNIGTSTGSFSLNSINSGYVNYTMPKSKYKLFGKDIEIDGYKDTNISMLLTHINLHGIVWYMKFKEQYTDSEVPLPEELSKELEVEIIAYKRDKHISDIISD